MSGRIYHKAALPAAQRHVGTFAFGNSTYYYVSPLHGRLDPRTAKLHRQKVRTLHGHSSPLPAAATRDAWHGKGRTK